MLDVFFVFVLSNSFILFLFDLSKKFLQRDTVYRYLVIRQNVLIAERQYSPNQIIKHVIRYIILISSCFHVHMSCQLVEMVLEEVSFGYDECWLIEHRQIYFACFLRLPSLSLVVMDERYRYLPLFRVEVIFEHAKGNQFFLAFNKRVTFGIIRFGFDESIENLVF